MSQASPDDQEKLLELLTEAAQSAGPLGENTGDIANFEAAVMRSLEPVWVARPLGLRMRMKFFRLVLWVVEHLLALPLFASSLQRYYDELGQMLRFGIRFGRLANAPQRSWCAEQIDRLGISHFDAPILIWSYTIDFRQRRFYFGHWDWIVGVLFMLPIGFLLFAGLSIFLCPRFPPADKPIYTLVCLVTVIITFKLCTGSSFNVYRTGRRYFQAKGLGLTPEIRLSIAVS